MLTSAQVRERLNIGKNKYLRLVKSGELPAIRIGEAPNSPYRHHEEDIQAYLERRAVKPQGVAS